jgi:hypothetical protein
MLKRTSLLLLVALFAVSCDDSLTQPNASDTQLVEVQFDAQNGNPVVRRVTVGGADGTAYGPPGSDANFSLVALERADGTVTGQIQDAWYKNSGFHAKLDCMSVDGTDVWVSGTVTKSDSWPEIVGRTVNVQVRDGGDSGEDMISPAFFFLPYTCVDQFPFEDYGFLFPVNNGQVKLN